MSSTQKSKFRVFFSWQSDSPSVTNSSAIRKALTAAAQRIENKSPDLKILNDEATRDTSGSPNIAQKIVEKIDSADAYVADITTITAKDSGRPCPNPNVAFELGYAVAQLGWDRIILLFNEAHGDFPGDLPFDVNQQRASPYTFSASQAEKAANTELSNLLTVAIRAIIEKNPKTPIELRGMSKEKVEHQRDVENIEWLLSQIHIPSLDDHILELPHSFFDNIFWYWESFKGVLTNSLFHLYDPILEKCVTDLYNAWATTLAFPDRYHDAGKRYIFTNPGDLPLRPSAQRVWDKIEAARNDMHQALQALLDRVRTSYIEVNIKDTNSTAWKRYKQDQEDAKKLLDD